MTEVYYYQCAIHVPTEEIHCMRDTTGYKDFENPSEYKGGRTLFALNKERMDKLVPAKTARFSGPGLILNLTNMLVHVETFEARLLTGEFKNKQIVVFDVPSKTTIYH